MKKSILILSTVLTSLAISLVGYLNWNKTDKPGACQAIEKPVACQSVGEKLESTEAKANFDLFFDLSTRYVQTISRADLLAAKSVLDIIPKEHTNDIEYMGDVKFTILDQNAENKTWSKDHILSSDQKNLIESINYSDNILIEAYTREKDNNTCNSKLDQFIYYMTVVPETQAEYIGGQDAINSYFTKMTDELPEFLNVYSINPARVEFTLGSDGSVKDLELMVSSANENLDKKTLEYLTNMPKNWTPASNSKGEAIDQELVLFFGKPGC